MQAITAIGISKKSGLVCDVDLATSESGLYLDQLPGLGADWFASDNNYGACSDPKSYLSRMVNARNEALDLVQEAIIRGLKGEHRLQKYEYQWYIGQRSGVGIATGTTLVLKTGRYTDAKLHISKVGVVASGEGSVDITLSYPDAPAQVFTIPVETNGYTGINSDLLLPLDGTEYTFEVTNTTGTVKLQSNAIGCGCGQKDTALFSYIRFNASYAAGISLTAAIKCDPTDSLSRIYASDADVKKVMARMLLYMAGVILCDYIYGEVTPQEHDTNLEYIAAKRAELKKEFDERLAWLMETGIEVHGSACFICEGARVVSIG